MREILSEQLLFDYYGNLLTKKQRTVLEYYFEEDLQLSEIAQILNISRQAVYDQVRRSIRLLKEFDQKLNLIKAEEISHKKINQVILILNELKAQLSKNDQIKMINNCIKILNNSF